MHSWRIFVEDSRIQTRVYEYFNSPWNSVNLETVVQCTANKEEIDRQKEDKEEREWKAIEAKIRVVWREIDLREVMEVFKLIDLFMFATLDEIERSFLSLARSLVDIRVLCTNERCGESILGMGLDSTWGARDFCGSSKLNGFRATSNMRKSLNYAARVTRVRIHGIRKDIPRPTKRR